MDENLDDEMNLEQHVRRVTHCSVSNRGMEELLYLSYWGLFQSDALLSSLGEKLEPKEEIVTKTVALTSTLSERYMWFSSCDWNQSDGWTGRCPTCGSAWSR